MVWQLRAEIHATWPTPTDEDARFFVSTEVNEILEAYLRNERHYARNNTKLLNPVDELADFDDGFDGYGARVSVYSRRNV
jgi:hypothetical protein